MSFYVNSFILNKTNAPRKIEQDLSSGRFGINLFARSFRLACKRLTVNTRLFSGMTLMSTNLYSIKGTVVFHSAMIFTLGNGALNALICFVFAVIHNYIPLGDIYFEAVRFKNYDNLKQSVLFLSIRIISPQYGK